MRPAAHNPWPLSARARFWQHGANYGRHTMSEGRLVIGTRRYSSWSLRGWLSVRLAALDVEEMVIPVADGPTPAIKAATPSGTVPYLEHRGIRIWESLAIAEYCAEISPALWPSDPTARAHARSVAAEMHAGFRELRTVMPMNLFRTAPAAPPSSDVLADVARIDAIWREALAVSGGPFLFGATFGNADAMYAPVVCRFLTYRPDLSVPARAYCAAVRAHPLLGEWYDLAAKEPQAWRLAKYEAPK